MPGAPVHERTTAERVRYLPSRPPVGHDTGPGCSPGDKGYVGLFFGFLGLFDDVELITPR
jgi:hypothetical protein